MLDAVHVWALRTSAIADAQKDAANLARSLGQQAEDTVRAADISILGVVQRLNIDGANPDTLEKLRQIIVARLTSFPALGGSVVTDANGKCLLIGTPTMPNDCTLAGRADFEYHRTHPDGPARLNPPVRAKGSGTWVIPLSHRFNNRDGSFAGIVVVDVSIPHLVNYYDSFDIGSDGAILLALDDGTLLARRPFAEPNIGRSLADGDLFKIMLPRSPVGIGKTKASTDGIVRFFAYRKLDAYPLVIAVGLSMDDALQPWRDEVWPHLIVTGALIMVVGFFGVRLATQIRERRRAESAYRLLADNSTDIIMRVGPDSRRVYVSPSIKDLTGHEPDELLAGRHGQLIHPDDRADWAESFDRMSTAGVSDATYRAARKDGSYVWVEASRRRLPDGGFVVCMRDISDRKRAEDQLAEANRKLELLARSDALTGVANRRQFDEALESEFRRAVRERTVVSLIMIDVDRFKAFNDNYGHPAGDRCLRKIAQALAAMPQRPGDLIARYGGEEFVILLPNTPEPGALSVAERARCAVRALGIEHRFSAAEIVTISLGVASQLPAPDGSDASALVSEADRALYDAKARGRDTVSAFAPP